MISILVTPRVFALAGCDRLVSEPLVIEKRNSRKIRIPIDLYPCQVEEKLIVKEVKGETIMIYETKITANDGTVTKFPKKFPRYPPSNEEEEEEPNKTPNYENFRVNANGGNVGNGGNNGFSYKGFMACNPKEYDRKGGFDLVEHPSSSKRSRSCDRYACTNFKVLLVEEFCPSNEMEKLETEFWNHNMRYIAGLAPKIQGMLQATQPTTIQSAILRDGILTNEIVSCGTLTKGNEKRKGVEEISKPTGSWKENKKAKMGTGFVAIAPPRNEYVGPYLKCAKCYSYLPEDVPCKVCYNCQKLGHFAKDCRAPYRQVVPVNTVRMGNNQRVFYECGSSDHLRNTSPKMNRAPGQAGNPLALEGTVAPKTMGIE
ncbi:reverse transcriptase domain-containing protein [Tanacetum coccineum]